MFLLANIHSRLETEDRIKWILQLTGISWNKRQIGWVSDEWRGVIKCTNETTSVGVVAAEAKR